MFGKLKAGSRPTFLEATFANRVLGFLDAIMRGKIIPAGAGKIVATEDSFVIDLSALQAANQAQQIADLQKALASAQGQITAINTSLRKATINSVCNPSDQTITTTLVLPNLP